jgi:hypothetical protein
MLISLRNTAHFHCDTAQLWRLLTGFIYFGPLGFGFLMSLVLLYVVPVLFHLILGLIKRLVNLGNQGAVLFSDGT